MNDPFSAPPDPRRDNVAKLAMGQELPGLGEWLEELIWSRAARSPRSLQRTPGPSALGTECDRQLAHTIAGTPPVNHAADPWAAIVGTAVHAWMAGLFEDLDGGTGRYLVEQRISYQGVSGTYDLYDRRRRLLIDWKTCKLDRLRTIRREGPPHSYVVQSQVYAAGLAESGEAPNRAALVFLPVDGRLRDLYVWATEPNPEIAATAVTRMRKLRGVSPADAEPTPSRLCPWCDHYSPTASDLTVACPGPMRPTKGPTT